MSVIHLLKQTGFQLGEQGSLLSQLDYFHQDFFLGDAVNSGQQNVIVNDGTIDQDFIANKTGNNSIAMEKKVNVQN